MRGMGPGCVEMVMEILSFSCVRQLVSSIDHVAEANSNSHSWRSSSSVLRHSNGQTILLTTNISRKKIRFAIDNAVPLYDYYRWIDNGSLKKPTCFTFFHSLSSKSLSTSFILFDLFILRFEILLSVLFHSLPFSFFSYSYFPCRLYPLGTEKCFDLLFRYVYTIHVSLLRGSIGKSLHFNLFFFFDLAAGESVHVGHLIGQDCMDHSGSLLLFYLKK